MTRRIRTPNFRSWRATILHRPNPAIDNTLTRQLERLGIQARQTWPEMTEEDAKADVVLFDGDMCHDGQFPWVAGQPPMPLIALVGSEAPGRLEWMLAQGTCAHILKPVPSSGVFSALVVACHTFEQRIALEAEVAELKSRLRRRPLVARALVKLMMVHGVTEEQAYRALRSSAMEQRQTIEDYCEAVLSAADGDRASTAQS